ncbi:MAG: DUF6702 family protein [Pseudomonadota bacterium]
MYSPHGWRCVALIVLLMQCDALHAHPLQLSLTQIEYADSDSRLSVSLRLFLMDVNEALVFDPDSTELAFCQPNESPDAEPMLLAYLNEVFFIKVNGQRMDLNIERKHLTGSGIDVALVVEMSQSLAPPLSSLEIKNTVFTDLFPGQTNIVYVHVNGDNQSLMLNKKTPTHVMQF